MSIREFHRRGTLYFDIRNVGPDGVPFRVKRRAPLPSEKASRAWAKSHEALLVAKGQTKAEAKSPPCKELWDAFVSEYLVANKRKPSYVYLQRCNWRAHIEPEFGDVSVNEIDTAAVQQFKAKKVALAPKTVNSIISTLAAFVKWAESRGLVSQVPTFKLVKVPKRKPKFLTDDEYERLVSAAARCGPKHLAVILLAGDVGLRRGEILALRPDHIDLGSGTMLVANSEWRREVTTVKGAVEATVPLNRRVANALAAVIKPKATRLIDLGEGKLKDRYKPLYRLIVEAKTAAGLNPTAHIHILRHTFGTRVNRLGNVRLAQQMLRHSDVRVTEIYTHVQESEVKRVSGLLNPHEDDLESDGDPAGTTI